MGNVIIPLEINFKEESELLRPLLKEWLDQNLPDIVERVVRKEIARVTDRLDFK